MSADKLALLRQQLAAGEVEPAENTARELQSAPGLAFADLAAAVQHAIMPDNQRWLCYFWQTASGFVPPVLARRCLSAWKRWCR